MIVKYENELHKNVNMFKDWAAKNYPDITEYSDNGEWELESDEFYEMVYQIVQTIENTSPHNATDTMIDDILYGIARDNESSTIMELLEDYPKWFSFLCKRCLKTEYRNAKWQFATDLRFYKGNDGLQKIIYDYLSSDDEYTERMALQTLAYIYPEQAEKYAVMFWNRKKYENDEYQKMMAIRVLYLIKSDKLQYYLALSEKLDYEYLKSSVKVIREKLQSGKF